jgi:hypothetical protein
MKGSPAVPGSLLASKPTWSVTHLGHQPRRLFLFLGLAKRNCHAPVQLKEPLGIDSCSA